jgi:alginate O-acetyltransferase complex protein AlgI
MVFASPVFLFVFFPVVLLVYRLIPAKVRPYWLLLSSLFFYFWGEPVYVLLMIAAIVITWGTALGISALKERKKEKAALAVLTCGIMLILSALIYFKYFEFLATTLKNIFHTRWRIKSVIMPIGISFYTFQAMSYLWDVHRGSVKIIRNPFKLGAYISMFPQLIAGPIVRASDITENLDAPQMTLESTWHGMIRLIRGLGKKVILANALATVIESNHTLPTDECSAGLLWLITLCYAFQIYFDFSGYSDMAIGMGEILGFRFPENFRFPYIAVSVRDFWRRWHMTLSSWLRDYVYIPLGGNRKGTFRAYLNLLLVFLICGFWHGASWNFVLWGLWYGLWLILERIPPIQRLLKKIPKPVTWFFTMVIVLLGWVLFRNLKPDETLMFLRGMFGGNSYITVDAFSILSPKLIIILAACLFLASPLAEMLLDRVEHMKGTGITVIRSVLALAVLAVCIILLMSDTYNPFIYFRF